MNHRECGYTLTGSLYVLLIVSLLSVTGVQAATSLNQRLRLKQACYAIGSLLHSARDKASRDGSAQTVSFKGGVMRYDKQERQLASGLSLRTGEGSIHFYPGLVASPRTLEFENTLGSCTLTVSLRGRVRLGTSVRGSP